MSEKNKNTGANEAPVLKNPEEMTQEELVAEVIQSREDLKNFTEIIEEQNQAIEAADAKAGTATGNFFEHKGKKIELRGKKFKLRGKEYTLADLVKNVKIEIETKQKDSKVKPVQTGIVDYLLEIKSPILEVE